MILTCYFYNLNFFPGYYLLFQCQIRGEDGDVNGRKAVLRRNKAGGGTRLQEHIVTYNVCRV